jgi:hypothetical protein
LLTGRAEDGRSYALLVDGTTLTIRPSGQGDYEAVKRLHEAMSPENLYFRFFSASRVSAEREARRVCLEGRPGTVALLGLLDDELVGVASYELVGDGAAAEVAVMVADGMHRRGIATLLRRPPRRRLSARRCSSTRASSPRPASASCWTWPC